MTDRLRALRYLALAVSALAATAAYPADQLILGKKLLIKIPPAGIAAKKVVHIAKDASIMLGAAGSAGDPQCTGAGGGGGSLRIAASGGAGDVTLPLPCQFWTTNATNTLYKYKNPVTNFPCALVLVKKGVLVKAVCKGSQVAIDVDASMSPVAVALTLNEDAFCTEFGGTAVKDGADDKTFLRKDAAAPAGCPTTSSTSTTSTTSTTLSCPGGASVGGACWYFGAAGASCDSTCAAVGRTYDAATRTYAGSDGTYANCGDVAQAFGSTIGLGEPSCGDGYGCVDLLGGSYARCPSPPTTSSASLSGSRRFCACM